MIDFLKWFLLLEVLGLISLPLSWSVFQKLRSRGIYLAKALGLLLWAFLFWWLTTIGLLKNDTASAISALFILLVINLLILRKIGFGKLKEWLKENLKIILTSEILFLVAFAFMAVVRAANPEIINTEKFMEMAFINSILKSPTLPPQDPWLSGYGVSYYYFGYLMSALLIRLSGVASSIGYNLVSASWFALTALGPYGLLWDLLAKKEEKVPNRIYALAILAPIMLLIVSNWFGALDVIHSRGWVGEEFWENLQIPALLSGPQRLSWFPNRGGWSWWQASRVVQDFRLSGSTIEIIDEFPFFTFLLSDIHPHLLGMPFVFLAIAQALNAFNGGWEGEIKLFGKAIPINWSNALIALITLGGIAFLNTWDFPFYLLLMGLAFIWRRGTEHGWNGKRLLELVLFGGVGGVLSIVAYLPFYLSFASQAGGILPSLAFFTRGSYFWIMFGPLLLPIFAWLIYRLIAEKHFPSGKSLLITLGFFALLFVLSWGLGFLGTRTESLSGMLLGLQGAESGSGLLVSALLERLKQPGTIITIFLMVWLVLDYFVLRIKKSKSSELEETVSEQPKPKVETKAFVLLLVIIGALLVVVPEFVYLRDQFGTRMNTIFKFYYQAWILWSLAGAYFIAKFLSEADALKTRVFVFALLAAGLLVFGFSVMQQEQSLTVNFGSSWLDYLMLLIPIILLGWIVSSLVKKEYKTVLAIVCLAGLGLGLIYPTIELWNKTEGFQPTDGYSLDGKQDFYTYSPNEMIAAEWLEKAPNGVMAEAVSDTGGSYTTYNIISTFSGMPTVLGWIGHEAQWRGGYEEIGSRQDDLRTLYSSADWNQAQNVIDRYNIRYIVVGNLERQTYQLEESKFEENMNKVLDTASVDIYEVRMP